ncbi:unnamed protein product [Rhizophagus irregularis]|nr:unnamed protein product [Rhizophagus irregularis]
MKECCHIRDETIRMSYCALCTTSRCPSKRPQATDIYGRTDNNSLGVKAYKSRPLSTMINSVMSSRSLRSQSINLEKLKIRFEDDLIEGPSIKGENLCGLAFKFRTFCSRGNCSGHSFEIKPSINFEFFLT